ncbi:TonB-dependent receptor domain-containing protein [Phenylobacterium deserti]|uniref:TonB-dependent receptor n=1 Tax=Phenylobacterium deserti TaxID=1914756 RepID=A0A328AAI9_9CAUL|nr:TonB-dependent receptor [Phenylobacterium deserti]RAK51447.1 TonB-dependent receptor [Phenylobacterium deserti]
MQGYGVAAAAAAVLAGPMAHAQAQSTGQATTPARPTTPAPASSNAQRAAEPGTVSGITVTAQGNETRTSIDRRSYSLANDLQATAGSIGDALRNVPSVQVDLEGNLTLRGDANVTIMIDGKPSGMFRGESRATALQQLPADQFERVEVMTNPSAAIRPDGSGGVINLITKKGRGGGQTGSVRVAQGNEGRYNGGVSYAYNSKKIGFSADAGVWHDERDVTYLDERTRLYNNRFFDNRNLTDIRSRSDSRNARASLDYDKDDLTRFSGEIRLTTNENESTSLGVGAGLDNEGQLFNSATTEGLTQNRFSNGELSAGYRRKFSGDEHLFTFDVSQERTTRKFRAAYFTDATPALAGPYAQFYRTDDLDKTEAKAEYKRPVGEADRLVAGYNLEISRSDYDNYQFRGTEPLPRTADLRYTYRFKVDQQVHGLYGTYEHRMGDFGVLGGLRVELTELDADQLTDRVSGGNDYLMAYPSLHLQYRISDAQQVTASYSRRIQRPQLQDLNPARQFQDPFNYRQGNPGLKPQETDSYEAIWQYRKNGAFLLGTLYWRDSRNGVTDVTRDIGDGILLTRRENLTGSQAGGLELVANGRRGPKIFYSLSGNGYWTEVEGTTFGYTQTQSGWTYQGNFSVSWQVTAADQIQVNGFGRGKVFTPQGYQKPSGMVMVAYRHKFNKNWTGVVQVQDLFETMRQETVIDTPVLRARTKVDFASRAVFVSLRYSFGSGTNSRRPQQSMEEGPPAGGMGPF